MKFENHGCNSERCAAFVNCYFSNFSVLARHDIGSDRVALLNLIECHLYLERSILFFSRVLIKYWVAIWEVLARNLLIFGRRFVVVQRVPVWFHVQCFLIDRINGRFPFWTPKLVILTVSHYIIRWNIFGVPISIHWRLKVTCFWTTFARNLLWRRFKQ